MDWWVDFTAGNWHPYGPHRNANFENKEAG
jgi:hypothetical protein